eukprot:jgi/Mesvir1/27988/Mv20187-RA.1
MSSAAFNVNSRVARLAPSFRTQTNALFRKNLTFQKRNWRTNCCIVATPLLLCILLVLMQKAIDNALDDPSNKCGCVCLPKGDPNCRKVCGPQFSDTEQIFWCAIPHPVHYPALMQIPFAQYRAPIANYTKCLNAQGKVITDPLTGCPPASLLYTGGASQSLAGELAARMFADTDLLAVVASGDLTADADTLSDAMVMGTSANFPRNFYLEPAFDVFSKDKDYPKSPLYYLMSNCSVLPPAVHQQISAAWWSNWGGGFLDQYLAGLNGTLIGLPDIGASTNASDLMRTLQCVDAPIATEGWRDSVEDINQEIYAGYRRSKPRANQTIEAYVNAYNFRDTSRAGLAVDVFYNDTVLGQNDDNGPPTVRRMNVAINQASRAFLKFLLGDAYDVKLLDVREMPKPATELALDFSSLLGPLFYTWVLQLPFPVMISLLMYEKEQKLRMMMTVQGLGALPYWAVNYVYYVLLYLVYMVLFVIFGSAIGLNFFRETSYSLQFVFYMLYGNMQVAWAFLWVAVFSKAKTAMVVAYLYTFGGGLLGEFLYAFFIENEQTPTSTVRGLAIIPCFGLYRGLYEISQYAFVASYQGSVGLRWGDLSDNKNDMDYLFVVFVIEFIIFMILTAYLDLILDNGTGNRRHPLFFLRSCLGKRWTGGHVEHAVGAAEPRNGDKVPPGKGRVAADKMMHNGKVEGHSAYVMEGEDVASERTLVASIREVQEFAIVVKDLRKVFPGRGGAPGKVAVDNLSLAVEHGECFGLLGPNGAGKTTSISMLTGFLEPTSGEAFVEGRRTLDEMSAIYTMMGVCPQHDLLWDRLTGREHLLFYGRLRNLKGSALNNAVEAALRSVNLFNGGVGNKLAGKYSGGMKRRLSVAIAFIGNPLVCYLDEPSTGLDPASRKSLWAVVKEAKKDRAVILTTHSMEEAAALCDRLGIFVDGKLQCIGNPKELTTQYGSYFIFTITTTHEDVERAKELVLGSFPECKQTYAISGTQKFEIPKQQVSRTMKYSIL